MLEEIRWRWLNLLCWAFGCPELEADWDSMGGDAIYHVGNICPRCKKYFYFDEF